MNNLGRSAGTADGTTYKVVVLCPERPALQSGPPPQTSSSSCTAVRLRKEESVHRYNGGTVYSAKSRFIVYKNRHPVYYNPYDATNSPNNQSCTSRRCARAVATLHLYFARTILFPVASSPRYIKRASAETELQTQAGGYATVTQ